LAYSTTNAAKKNELRKQKKEQPIGQKDRRRGIEDIFAQQPVTFCDDNMGGTPIGICESGVKTW
jgi:hypothetical protein